MTCAAALASSAPAWGEETLKLTTPLSESTGEPLAVTVSGIADGSHRLYVYADEDRSGCAPNPAEEYAHGGRVVVLSELEGDALSSGSFSKTYTHSYTYQLPIFCGYLDETPFDAADVAATEADPVREYLENEQQTQPAGSSSATSPGAIEPAMGNPQLAAELLERLGHEEAERATHAQHPGVPQPLRCSVPSLTGHSLNAAKKALHRAGCKLGRVRTAARATHGAHLVIRQSQPRGTKLPAGAAVGLTLSARRR